MRREDPASGLTVEIAADGGSVLLCDGEGAAAGVVPAPAGYVLSHFVEQEGCLFVVGQGEVPVEGWPDWHFALDASRCRLVRAGPAY